MRELQLWETGESVGDAFADIETRGESAGSATAAIATSRAAR